MKHDIRITETNGAKKIIGVYDDIANEFTTKRNIEKHLLRKYNAWALDKDLVYKVLLPHKAIIIIIDTKEKMKYKITVTEFEELASEINFHQHRTQLYLNRDKFEVLKASV